MTVKHLLAFLPRLHAAFYFWRGRFHRHFGNLSGDRREYQSAVDDFSKAIDLHPVYVPALYSRGVLYWRELENYYRAVKDLTRVMGRLKAVYRSWAIACAGRDVYYTRHRAQWLAKNPAPRPALSRRAALCYFGYL